MQLPKGNFREIKKAELISSILNELEHTKFSGVCHISSDPASGTFVFKSGKCILAKIQHKSGDEAWDELLKMSNRKVNAALSNLDEAQVHLALEFNKACRMIKYGNTTPSAAHQSQKPAASAYGSSQIPVRQQQESPQKTAETEEPPQDSSSFERDIDTFDTLDLDDVTDKIRNDCKTIIRQLNLEHLMER
ncbi:MAG: hypothetical protein Q8N94_01605 [Methanoregula sp.]|nr:hypothetical protein [Methanoregula sp.]